MTTKLNVKELTPLQRHVYRWARAQARKYDNHDPVDPLKEVTEHGCSSGIVGHLIYYVDTLRFYRRFQKEIDGMLAETCSDCGKSPSTLFERTGWDNDDPLARDTTNKNILAWFGFEEAANTLLNMLEN
jgi:hypothetical protein